MHALKTWLGNPHRHFPLIPLLGVVMVLLLARNLGTYPGLFADEFFYSAFTRLTPAAEATIPSYLYYALFGVTNSCGDGFLECTRLLNVLLHGAAAPFIYLIGRRVMSPTRAGVLTLLALMAPFNVFTAYFMPETPFFLAFWAISWQALRTAERPSAARAAGAGALLGLAWLIKVHAMFLVPPLCVFLVYLAWDRRREAARPWPLNALLYLLAAIGVALLLRFALGYLLAGKTGLQLLGQFYTGAAGGGRPLPQLMLTAVLGLRGHLLALVFLFALPLGAMLLGALSGAARRDSGPDTRALMVYSFLMLGALLGVTTLFSAMMASGNEHESLGRLHMRYYDFAFPLLMLIGGAQAPAAQRDTRTTRRTRLLIALVLAAAVLYAYLTLQQDYQAALYDAPELWSLRTPGNFRLATAVALLTLACWAFSDRAGARAYLYVGAPLLMLVSATSVYQAVRGNSALDDYARAGIFTRNHLAPALRDKLTIIGEAGAGLYRAKFYIDRTEPALLVKQAGQAFTTADLGKHANWALVIGQHPAPEGAFPHNVDHGFTLYEMRRAERVLLAVEFNQAQLGLAATKGVSTPEPWGRWSDGKQLVFTTAAPLPVRLRLSINGSAAGPNVDAPFLVRVGAETREARFGASPGGVVLDFTTSGTEREITIEVPQPILASTVSPVNDPRMIGLALISMEVAERRAAAAAPE